MKPEYLLLIAVLLIAAVAIHAHFNPVEAAHGEENDSHEEDTTAEHAQEELASEIEKGNAELQPDHTLAVNPELENNDSSSAYSTSSENATEQPPIVLRAK